MNSAFAISKNVDSQGYPYIESIKSFLPVVDEMIIVDSSTDGSTEKIQALSNKIRIVKEPWEDNWSYWRMNHNFDRGFRECKGDIVMKFDCDRVLHEDGVEALKSNFQKMLNEDYLTITASAKSVPVVNRINFDKNQTICKYQEMQLSPKSGKLYFHRKFKIIWETHPLGYRVKKKVFMPFVSFDKPREDLAADYERKRELFMKKFYSGAVDTIEGKRKRTGKSFKEEYERAKKNTAQYCNSKGVVSEGLLLLGGFSPGHSKQIVMLLNDVLKAKKK